MDDAPLSIGGANQNLKRRSLQGAAATMAGQGVKFMFRFVSIVVTARLLNPADFGLVAMVAPILAFVNTVNDLGFTQAIVQRREITPQQISALHWMNLAVSILLAVLLIAVSPLVSAVYHEPRTGQILCVMATLVILSALNMAPTAILLRELRFVPHVLRDVGAAAVGVAVTVGAALLGLSFWSLVLGQLATSVTSLALLYRFTRWRPSPPRREAGAGALFRFGANLTVVNIAGYFSTFADNLLIGGLLGKVQLGLYDRSYNLVVQPVNQLMSPVSRVAIPLLSRLTDQPDLYRRTYLNLVRIALLFTTPAMIACTTLPLQTVHFLLGAKWDAAAPVFAWICLGGITAPIFYTTSWLYVTQARTGRQATAAIASAAIGVTSFVLGVRWGIQGVAACSAAAFVLLQTPLMLVGCTRSGLVRLADVAKALLPLAVAGGLTALILTAASPWVSAWRIVPAFGLAYVVFATATFLLPGGGELFRELVRLVGDSGLLKRWTGRRTPSLP
jgi:PST family polysaccharide transporter